MGKYQIYENNEKLTKFYKLFAPKFERFNNHNLYLASYSKISLNEKVLCLDRILAKYSEYGKLINEIKAQLSSQKRHIKLLDLQQIKQCEYTTDIRIMLMDLNAISDIEICTFFMGKKFTSVLPLFFIAELQIYHYFDIDIKGKIWIEFNSRYPDFTYFDAKRKGGLGKIDSNIPTKQASY